jgi:hypothetical protein
MLDASLCDDLDRAAGTLVFAIPKVDLGRRSSRFNNGIELEVCQAPMLMPHSGPRQGHILRCSKVLRILDGAELPPLWSERMQLQR